MVDIRKRYALFYCLQNFPAKRLLIKRFMVEKAAVA
jgi:hypothetical protein